MTPTLISVFSTEYEAAETKIRPAMSPLKMAADLILRRTDIFGQQLRKSEQKAK